MIVRIVLSCLFLAFITDHLPAEPNPTELVDAAERADWKSFESFVGKQTVGQTQPDGMSALHWAAFHGHKKSVRDLVKAGAQVDLKTRYEVTPMTLACAQGHDAVVHLLLESGADPNDQQPGGVTPLLIAARNGNPRSIEHLLERGAKIDDADRKIQTPLSWAAAEGNLDAVRVLVEHGADLRKGSQSGFNPMMFAAREGHLPVVEYLLQSGVDVNDTMQPSRSGARVPRKGTSALLMAIESGHFELAMYLVKQGADPNDQRNGFSPLHMIVGVRKPNRGEGTDGDPAPRGSGNLTSLDCVRGLIAAGADVNLKLKRGKSGRAQLNHTGATPMLLAGKTADLPFMRILVQHGADPLIPNVDGCTPLMACAGVGVRAVGEEAGTEPEVLAALQFLIEQGGDVNTVDKNKETAMHGAAYRCYPKVIQFLANNGSDPKVWNHKNKWGWTPEAIGHGHRPGSLKPHPPTVAAILAAKEKRVVEK